MQQETRISLWLAIITLSVLFSSIKAAPVLNEVSEEFGNERECLYQSKYYPHGTSIETEEACLNCTCNRGVLVCFLRVCHNLVAPPKSDCRVVRLPGRCCSEIICGVKEEITTTSTTTTEQVIHNRNTSTKKNQTTDPEEDIADSDHPPSSTVFNSNLDGDDVTTLSPSDITVDDSAVAAGCLFNESFYGEGSAMPSINVCEYCYCIRGIARCVKPQCHLHIDQCRPMYQHDFSCCPTAYQCSSHRKDSDNSLTTTTSTPTSIEKKQECSANGTVYYEGDAIPHSDNCQNCFCTATGMRCSTTQCAVEVDGCQPIIMPGKCCPTAYTCTATQSATDLDTTSISGISDELATGSGDNPTPEESTVTEAEYSTLPTESNSSSNFDNSQDASESRASSANNSTEVEDSSSSSSIPITESDLTATNSSWESFNEDVTNGSNSEISQDSTEVQQSTTENYNSTVLESDDLYGINEWSDDHASTESTSPQFIDTDSPVDEQESATSESTSTSTNELSNSNETENVITDNVDQRFNHSSELDGKNSILLTENSTESELFATEEPFTEVLVTEENNESLPTEDSDLIEKDGHVSVKNNITSGSNITKIGNTSAITLDKPIKIVSQDDNKLTSKLPEDSSSENSTSSEQVESTLATPAKEEIPELILKETLNNTSYRNSYKENSTNITNGPTEDSLMEFESSSTNLYDDNSITESTTEIMEITTGLLEQFLENVHTINYNQSLQEETENKNSVIQDIKSQNLTANESQENLDFVESRHPPLVTVSLNDSIIDKLENLNQSNSSILLNNTADDLNGTLVESSTDKPAQKPHSETKLPEEEYGAENHTENTMENVTIANTSSALFGSLNSIVNLLLEESDNVTGKPLHTQDIENNQQIGEILKNSSFAQHLDAILEDLAGDMPEDFQFNPIKYVNFSLTENGQDALHKNNSQIDSGLTIVQQILTPKPFINSEPPLISTFNTIELNRTSSNSNDTKKDQIQTASSLLPINLNTTNLPELYKNVTTKTPFNVSEIHFIQNISTVTELANILDQSQIVVLPETVTKVFAPVTSTQPSNSLNHTEEDILSNKTDYSDKDNTQNITTSFISELPIKAMLNATFGFSGILPEISKPATQNTNISTTVNPELETQGPPFVENDLQDTLEMILNLSKTFANSNNKTFSWAPSLNQTYDYLLNGTIPSGVEAKLTEIIRLAQAELLNNKGEPMHFNKSMLPFFHKFDEGSGLDLALESNATDDEWSPTEQPHELGSDYYDYDSDNAPVTIPNEILLQLNSLKNISLTSQISGDIHRDTDQHTYDADNKYNGSLTFENQHNESVIHDLHKIFLPLLNLSQTFSHSSAIDEPGRLESSQFPIENDELHLTTHKQLTLNLRDNISEQILEGLLTTESTLLIDRKDSILQLTLKPLTDEIDLEDGNQFETKQTDKFNTSDNFNDKANDTIENLLKNEKAPNNHNFDTPQNAHLYEESINKQNVTHTPEVDRNNVLAENRHGEINPYDNAHTSLGEDTLQENKDSKESNINKLITTNDDILRATINNTKPISVLEKTTVTTNFQETEFKENAQTETLNVNSTLQKISPNESPLKEDSLKDVVQNNTEKDISIANLHTENFFGINQHGEKLPEENLVTEIIPDANLNKESATDKYSPNYEVDQNQKVLKTTPMPHQDYAERDTLLPIQEPVRDPIVHTDILNKESELVKEDINEKVEPAEEETQYSHAVGPDDEKSYFGQEDYENGGDHREEIGGEISAMSVLDANHDEPNKNSPDDELHHYSEHGSFFDLPLDSKVDSQLEYKVDDHQFSGEHTARPTSQVFLKGDQRHPFDINTTIRSSDWRPIDRFPTVGQSQQENQEIHDQFKDETPITTTPIAHKQAEHDYSNIPHENISFGIVKSSPSQQSENLNHSILEPSDKPSAQESVSISSRDDINKPSEEVNPVNIPLFPTPPRDQSEENNQPGLPDVLLTGVQEIKKLTSGESDQRQQDAQDSFEKITITPTISFAKFGSVSESVETEGTPPLQKDLLMEITEKAITSTSQNHNNTSTSAPSSDAPVAQPLELRSETIEKKDSATEKSEFFEKINQGLSDANREIINSDATSHMPSNASSTAIHSHDILNSPFEETSSLPLPSDDDVQKPLFENQPNDTLSSQQEVQQFQSEGNLPDEPYPGTHHDIPLPHLTTEDFSEFEQHFNTNIDELIEAPINNTSPFVGLMSKGSIVFENVLPLSRRGRPNVDELTGQIHPTPRKSGSHPQTPATEQDSSSLTPDDVQVIPFLPEDAITEELLQESSKPTAVPPNRDAEPSIISKDDFPMNHSSIAVKVSASTSMQVHNEEPESDGAFGAAEPISMDDMQHGTLTDQPAGEVTITLTSPLTPEKSSTPSITSTSSPITSATTATSEVTSVPETPAATTTSTTPPTTTSAATTTVVITTTTEPVTDLHDTVQPHSSADHDGESAQGEHNLHEEVNAGITTTTTTMQTGHRPKSEDGAAIANEDDAADYCVENGEVFNNGERIPTHNICAQCKCVHGVVQCQHAACPQRPPGCVERILSSSCCPTFVCNETGHSGDNSGVLPLRNGITIHGGFLPIDGPVLPVSKNTDQQFNVPPAVAVNDRIDTAPPSDMFHHGEEEVHVESIHVHDDVTTTTSTTPIPTTESTGLFGSILAGIFGGKTNSSADVTKIVTDAPSATFPADIEFEDSPLTTTAPKVVIRTPEPRVTTSTGAPSRKRSTTTRSRPRATSTSATTTTESPVTEAEVTMRTKRPQQSGATPTKSSSPFAGLWPMLKVSGCNIYGRVYDVGKTIGVLSGPCKECKCGETGVECYRIKCF